MGGIGIGRNLAPAESAGAPVLPTLAPGFEAAAGWTVVDGGLDLPPGTHGVIAATVPIHRDGSPLDLAPAGVLSTLPPDGIVVAVAGRAAAPLSTREASGAPSLRLDGARISTRWEGPAGRERALAEYAFETEAGGLVLDVRVYLGSDRPSAQQLARAQAQLDRLVVAAAPAQVTIAARPTLVRWAESIDLAGSISAGRAGEEVTIEVRECGTSYWRVIANASTTSGGNWHTRTGVAINARLRARHGEATSAEVPVRARPGVNLRLGPGSRVSVGVAGVRPFWRKRVVLERFDRSRQRWVLVRRALLTESGPAGNFIWSSARFTARLQRGSLYRAVITNEQSGPCYLAGFSNMVRR